jgi:hypothetical protein
VPSTNWPSKSKKMVAFAEGKLFNEGREIALKEIKRKKENNMDKFRFMALLLGF